MSFVKFPREITVAAVKVKKTCRMTMRTLTLNLHIVCQIYIIPSLQNPLLAWESMDPSLVPAQRCANDFLSLELQNLPHTPQTHAHALPGENY